MNTFLVQGLIMDALEAYLDSHQGWAKGYDWLLAQQNGVLQLSAEQYLGRPARTFKVIIQEVDHAAL